MGRRRKFIEGIPREAYRKINGRYRRVWVTKMPNGYEKIVPMNRRTISGIESMRRAASNSGVTA